MKSLSLLLLFLPLLWACQPDTVCRQEGVKQLEVEFLSDSINATSGEVEQYRVQLDSLSIWGFNNDSILYDNSKNVASLSLPLRKDAEETRFVIVCNNITDTLRILHVNEEKFISLQCGYFVYHTLQDIVTTGHRVKGADIINQQITTADDTHVQLYIK